MTVYTDTLTKAPTTGRRVARRLRANRYGDSYFVIGCSPNLHVQEGLIGRIRAVQLISAHLFHLAIHTGLYVEDVAPGQAL